MILNFLLMCMSLSSQASELRPLVSRFDRELEQFAKNPQQRNFLENPIYHELREFEASRRLSVFKFQRRPKKLKIKPSAGVAGQINGGEFPRRTWSMTFDDGPLTAGGVTIPIVDEVVKRGFLATFFMVVKMLDADLLGAQYVRDHGMTIGNHSYTHAHLEDPACDVDHEISGAKIDIETQLKTSIALFRFPYGEGQDNPLLRQKVADSQMVSVLWNVDSLDWADEDPASISKRTITQIEAQGNRGGIILFHDIHPSTLQAAAQVMNYLQSKKMKICAVDRVIAQINTGKSCER